MNCTCTLSSWWASLTWQEASIILLMIAAPLLVLTGELLDKRKF